MIPQFMPIPKRKSVKSRVNEKLDDALGLASNSTEVSLIPEIMPEIVTTGNDDADMESDLAAARKGLHDVAQKGAALFDVAVHFAQERQDARSVEAAVQAQRESRDSLMAIIDFHKKRKEIEHVSQKGRAGGDTTINQTVFCGTTSEMLKMMKDLKEAQDDSEHNQIQPGNPVDPTSK